MNINVIVCLAKHAFPDHSTGTTRFTGDVHYIKYYSSEVELMHENCCVSSS